MQVNIFPRNTIYIVTVIAALFSFTACGSDSSAPSIDTSFIPQTVFFNNTGSPQYYLFMGRAADNTNVDTVLVSADNGATWHTAEIDNAPPNHIWDVEWTYLASSADLSAGMHTVLVRAADRDNNETTSGPVILESISSSDPAILINVFRNAAEGDLIGLSTGEGSAYGDSSFALTIPITVDLTVLGSGYGNMMTSGGHSPVGNSIGTVLDTSSTTASLFSIDADLTIRDMRLLGGANGINISESGSADLHLSVEDCLFDRQSGWSVHARSDGGGSVEFISSIVDASRADSSAGNGGLLLDNVNYTVYDSRFNWKSDIGPGAGIQALEGTGSIDNCIFDENALAIWASGGSPVITSCNISGAAFTSYGINLTGGPGAAEIRRNTIDGNTGYGLRVGGEMELTLRNNEITNNGLSGVLIDSELGNTRLTNIDMGTTSSKGNNHFNGNKHSGGAGGYDTQVYVTMDTNEGPTLIPANWNYWGVATIFEVNLVIIDGNDDSGRATLAIGSFWTSAGGEVGP